MHQDELMTTPVHARRRYWVLDLNRTAPNNVTLDGKGSCGPDGYCDSSESFDEAAFFARENRRDGHRIQVIDSRSGDVVLDLN